MSSVDQNELSIDNSTNISSNEEENLLKAKIEEDPLDILSHLNLVKYYETNNQFDNSKKIFEDLNSKFPFYSPLYTIQLKIELQKDEFGNVEQILSKCLSGDYQNNDLNLWMTYLDYVRRKNNLITGGQEARSIVISAFQLVLEKCAIFEPISNQFWSDYLNFLQNWKPVNKWEEQQKIDLIRKLFKRMLSVPFDNLEKLWSKYTQWEQEINNLTARKFISEISASYMKARSIFLEWSNLTKNLKRSYPFKISNSNKNNIPQKINNNNNNDNSINDQLKIWINWINWEKENKLELSDDLLKLRIDYVYKQAIQFMLFYPQIWFSYSLFIENGNSKDKILKSQNILKNGLLANPNSALLTFKLSELYELENDIENIQKTFDNCINFNLIDCQNFIKKNNLSLDDENINNDPNSILYQKRYKLTYIYCIFMNIIKRSSGLTNARSVFGKCRKLKNLLTHHVYIENAYLEFQNQISYKTPCKVLELGLKYFQNDGTYINKYLDFLILVNRDSQIKTLFEMSADRIKDKFLLKLIYKKIIFYESKFGNLDNVYSLQKRFLDEFPDEKLIDIFTNRYQLQNENSIKLLELPYLPMTHEETFLSSYSRTSSDQFNSINYSHIDNSSSSRKRPFQDTNDTSNNNSNNNKKMKKQNLSIPQEFIDLLTILPKRQYFKNALLDPKKLIDFIDDQVEIPIENKTSTEQ